MSQYIFAENGGSQQQKNLDLNYFVGGDFRVLFWFACDCLLKKSVVYMFVYSNIIFIIKGERSLSLETGLLQNPHDDRSSGFPQPTPAHRYCIRVLPTLRLLRLSFLY